MNSWTGRPKGRGRVLPALTCLPALLPADAARARPLQVWLGAPQAADGNRNAGPTTAAGGGAGPPICAAAALRACSAARMSPSSLREDAIHKKTDAPPPLVP